MAAQSHHPPPQDPSLEADVEVEPEESATPVAELDPETRARRDAALALIRKFGDPVLGAKALPVERFDDRLTSEIDRMGLLMDDALGIGLAATQLGVLHRLLVYRVQADSGVIALVNPELDYAGEETETMEEGCLSLPGIHVEVERPIFVRVRARDGRNQPISIEASGLEARVIQHEMDHLDGVLILDRVPRELRKQAMRELREAQAGSPVG
jgi:peptide deformylase